MEVIKLSNKNFESEVLNSEGTVLVDFYADWCGPCKMQGPVIEEFAKANSDIKVCKINVDDEPDISVRYKVVSIPLLAVFKNGELVKTEVGLHDLNALKGLVG